MPKPSRSTRRDSADPAKGKPDKWASMGASVEKGRLTWADCGAEDLQAAAVAVTEDGAALLLAKTSDGGALCIQVWNGQGRHKLYPASVSELNEALRTITDIADDA